MPLTTGQLSTLKADIAANTNTVNVDGTPTQIKDVLQIPDLAALIVEWYNQDTSPNYFVWRSKLMKKELTRESGIADDGATPTNFVIAGTTGGYINRSVGERDAFDKVVFDRNDETQPNLANIRTAMVDIFSGAGAGASANRDHFRAKGRRPATRAERLYVVATVGGPAQTGARGARTNPDTLGFEGKITLADVVNAWAAP